MNPLVLTAVLTLTALAFAALGWLARPPVTRWRTERRELRKWRIDAALWTVEKPREVEHE
jgi:hypothetical protein